MTGYLDELAVRLRDGGVAAERASSLVADLRAHLEETGADPESEFGPVDAFAAEFTGSGSASAPEDQEPESEHWSWTTDTFADVELLNRHGDQGWEVTGVDGLGRFVCRRDTADPQRWEYRREVVIGGRASTSARLAPDGWEPCGAWVIYEWYKRPLAASIGPASAVAEPPPAPHRSTYFTRRGLAIIAAPFVVLGAMAIVSFVTGDAAEGLGLITGGLVGALAGALAVFGYARRQNRSR